MSVVFTYKVSDLLLLFMVFYTVFRNKLHLNVITFSKTLSPRGHWDRLMFCFTEVKLFRNYYVF
jgi:hypothetical protein